MPNPCQPIIDKIRALEKQKSELNGSNEFPGVPPGLIPPSPIDHHGPELEALNKQLLQEAMNLNACLLKGVSPVPMVMSVKSISCRNANDPGPFESDEPYVLVYVLNLPSLANPALPSPKVVLVGPLSGVDAKETHPAPANILWGINGAPATIPNPDDIILLVAMLENDNAPPASVRTAVEVAMGPILALNLTSIGNRAEFVARLSNGMQGAIQTAVKLGLPDPDDQIGTVQELRISRLDVAKAFHFGNTTLDLTFKGDDSHFKVNFQLKRP
ncbi:hypothetical protein ATI61_10519 [Archangium gephyra]|uniref:Uncharacterized protein n=1 Tax=Archangium gephyra TaxID=48 RepID=A0AAC8QGG9_9BACT|nr:hypothetical protein [Archangium gephyra]AKJ07019.1 Hypothetical protein AA314_08645 [Archangium gephyra]REG31695.1 hypothetical protein ATI61_10519 [Archangium gephyra]